MGAHEVDDDRWVAFKIGAINSGKRVTRRDEKTFKRASRRLPRSLYSARSTLVVRLSPLLLEAAPVDRSSRADVLVVVSHSIMASSIAARLRLLSRREVRALFSTCARVDSYPRKTLDRVEGRFS